MSAIDQLLRLTTEYARAADIGTNAMSWRLFGDSKRLQQIIDGGDLQVKRWERALRWLSQNWPANAVWPKDIARPKAQQGEAA